MHFQSIWRYRTPTKEVMPADLILLIDSPLDQFGEPRQPEGNLEMKGIQPLANHALLFALSEMNSSSSRSFPPFCRILLDKNVTVLWYLCITEMLHVQANQTNNAVVQIHLDKIRYGASSPR